MKTEKLLAEAGDSEGTQKCQLLEAATKERLVKTEDFMCAVVIVIFECVTQTAVLVCSYECKLP
jgi:hypothetical protein